MQRRASLSVAVQGAALEGRFPDSELRMCGMTLTWTARLRPTALSREYTIRLTYSPDGYPPRVEVVPKLASRPGEPLPHVYADGSLCLHVPGEWVAEGVHRRHHRAVGLRVAPPLRDLARDRGVVRRRRAPVGGHCGRQLERLKTRPASPPAEVEAA